MPHAPSERRIACGASGLRFPMDPTKGSHAEAVENPPDPGRARRGDKAQLDQMSREAPERQADEHEPQELGRSLSSRQIEPAQISPGKEADAKRPWHPGPRATSIELRGSKAVAEKRQ